ncbi:MAG: hypothetical protein EXR79_03910 [Myxococcales bacterium]|nr:hypothetical protein [Myxococcales bacterium]
MFGSCTFARAFLALLVIPASLIACTNAPAGAGGGTNGGGAGPGAGTGTPPANVPASNPNSPLPVSANLATATQTAEGLCLALMDANCGGQVACKKAATKVACLALKATQRNVADCIASVGPAIEMVKKGTVKIDQAKFTACYSAIGSMCLTQSPAACADFATGGRKLGDPCVDSTECKPAGFCDKAGVGGQCQVGKCTVYAKAGESCDTAKCAAGLTCKDGKVCAVPPKAGEACDMELSCDASQYCSAAKVCTVRVAAGGACKTGLECPSGAQCVSGTCHTMDQLKALAGVAPSEGFSNPSTSCKLDKETNAFVCTLKSATAYVGKGSPCVGALSGESSGSTASGGGAARRPVATDAASSTKDAGSEAGPSASADAGVDGGGEPSGPPPVNVTRICKIGFLCDTVTKVCVDPPPVGAACEVTLACGPYLTCDAATKACALPPGAGKPCDKDCAAPFTCDATTQVCGARKDAGKACTSGDECASDSCKSKLCAAACAVP